MAEHFLRDLAVVLLAAAITTVVFQRLRLPVVLGYLLAGVFAGPRTPIRMVVNEATINTLASLGVILIMFGIGLTFRLRRVISLIPTAGLTALIELSLMVTLGYSAGQLLGWNSVASFFAGGVVAISSTMIVAKVLEESAPPRDLQEFVFAVLVFEDLAAVLLLTVLSAIGTGTTLSGPVLGRLIASLGVVLFAMLAGGMLVVPRALRFVASLLRPETMLVAAVGLCFGMAALAEKSGFSVALGAFLAGCLVAEAGIGRQVEREVRPVRDLFGAIFFVAVGMQFDPAALAAHWPLVLLFTLIVMFGKTLGVTVGAFLAGRGVKAAVETALSVAQIGEFAFIIASVGLAAGVVPPELYTVAIAVSAITAFTTPLFVRWSGALAQFVDRKLPGPIQTFASLYGSWIETLRHVPGSETPGQRVRRSLRLLLLDAAAVLAVTLSYALLRERILGLLTDDVGLPLFFARGALAFTVLAVIGPFIVGIVSIARRLGLELAQMAIPLPVRGVDNAVSPRRLLANALQITTVILMGIPLVALLQAYLPALPAVVVLLGILALLGFGFLRSARDLQGHLKAGAEVVVAALAKQSATETASVDLARRLLPGLGDFTALRISEASPAHGRTLGQLNLRGRTGATIVALLRGDHRIAFPEAGEQLQAGDMVALTGSHDAIAAAEVMLVGETAGAH
ncbi:MAG TPA: cation:proton antiporter [Gemmatimonadales bacterium]|nr:cation:proton antiporter [Gemmatimonadales bacterium]